MTRTCSDCCERRKHCRPVAQLADRTVVYVCEACWLALDYARYMYGRGARGANRQ